MPQLKATPDWLRANITEKPIGVDREKEIIHGFIVAEEGAFKSEGRGEFDGKSLRSIVQLMRSKPNGLKSRFTHPGLSSDGLGTMLGRAKAPRLDTVMRLDANGQEVQRQAVRADLHLSPTSHNTPNGDLGTYVMDLAEEAMSDAQTLGASLVLKSDKVDRLNKNGTPMTDANGEPLPPIWYPTVLHAIDVVDVGDATNAFLSGDIDSMPDMVVRKAVALLDAQFPDGTDRDAAEARTLAMIKRVFDLRWGERQAAPLAASLEILRLKARLRELGAA